MKKILFVDDEKNLTSVMKLILFSIKDHITFVSSGEEVVKLLTEPENKKQIQLVLLDLNMPGMDGLDVLKWMRDNKIKTNVVLQTGINIKNIHQQAKEFGVKQILLKPYKNKELFSVINEYTDLKM